MKKLLFSNNVADFIAGSSSFLSVSPDAFTITHVYIHVYYNCICDHYCMGPHYPGKGDQEIKIIYCVQLYCVTKVKLLASNLYDCA